MNDELDTLLETVLEQSLARHAPTRAQALSVLKAEDERVLELVAAAGKVRRRFFSNKVKCNFLINMKSGLCPEDCSYCSQRRGSDAEILKYSWVEAKAASELADLAVSGGAKRICLVASGRGPSAKDLGRVSETVRTIKERHPDVEICVSLGLLQEGQSEQLVEAGVFAYNHNLNTAEARYDEICTTHTFADRVETLGRAEQSGLSPCSGAIFGMGESDEDIVELALSLRGLDPDSVPINFLMPFEGTPLAGRNELSPARCLKILALFRFVFPDVEVRIAAGREMHLRSLQPLALHLANSLFLGDYLTSEGQAGRADLQMIADAGFVVEGHEEETFLPERRAQVKVRRRGPGTSLPANI